MKHLAGVVVCCLLLVSTAFAEPQLEGTPKDLADYLAGLPETVQITAEATLAVQAQRAVVIINAVTDNASLQSALKENEALRGKITRELTASGIAQDRIAGTRFSSTPTYGLWGEKPKSYRVENILKITIDDEKQFQHVAAIVDKYDDVYYGELQFVHQDRAELKREVLLLLLADLEKKRAIYEEKLDVKLTPASFADASVSEGSPLRGMPIKAGADYSIGSSKMRPESPGAPVFGAMVFGGHLTVEYVVNAK